MSLGLGCYGMRGSIATGVPLVLVGLDLLLMLLVGYDVLLSPFGL
jgi:hypothetical protein